jgi:hypothetical protein
MTEKLKVFINHEIGGASIMVDENSIRNKLIDHMKSLVPRVNFNDLNGWALTVTVLLQSKDAVSVAKRAARFPSDEEFGIYISIPIPNKKQAPYGIVDINERSFFKPVDKKWSYSIDPQFNNYDNLGDYIFQSTVMAIDFIFARGFTCNGKKIKFTIS